MPIISGDIARQIANTHTIFNVVNTIIMLPFVPLFVKILNKIVPGKDYEKVEGRFLDKNLLPTPALAIEAVVKELVVMLSICQEMFKKARQCTLAYNHKLKNEVTIDEESVDEMQKNITEYIIEITRGELLDKQTRLIPAVIHSVNDIEKVGDYCENIVNLAQRAYEHDLFFSREAATEFEKLFDKTEILMRHTSKALKNNDQQSASITLNIEREIDELIDRYKINHLSRLEEGVCISDSGLIFSDILTDIERLNNHLCNVTKGILHQGKR
jgi:phosphate:Na+ symporter